ncbi:low-density lipoprotein receptor-related protein 1B-like [Arvicanthis niloticus]|uniref:low-density lipoprotein receptor-related protein 1B-like n=2 Tax=Arvicanthis niloticus TaxID=61156 RepID=UPI00403C2A97
MDPHQDECSIYGICSQTCKNTYGSYACSCVEGYIMQSDNRSCKVKNEPTDKPPMLLIASPETIELFYINGSKMTTISSANRNEIHTLDFIYSEEIICWIESRESSNELKCGQMTKSGRLTDQKIIVNSLQSFHNVEQMAIDWLTKNIYFVDHVSDRIFVCNFNGSVCVTLIELELHNPKAIAADPIAGRWLLHCSDASKGIRGLQVLDKYGSSNDDDEDKDGSGNCINNSGKDETLNRVNSMNCISDVFMRWSRPAGRLAALTYGVAAG